MPKLKKKHTCGTATDYISRSRAIRKLQLSLKDFRRLCIIKGIHPHIPRNRNKANKGKPDVSQLYYTKDIQFLAHEPIISKFREEKIFMRKLKRAMAKGEKSTVERMNKRLPKYALDHIVRERYPTFVDAIRDLDDALCMVFLFANLPASKKVDSYATQMCRRLSAEFLHYVIAARALRKVFISIKGIYYQVELLGQTCTWITPHERCMETLEDVDYNVMSTFVEFYITMVGFVNFKLYNTLGLHYPPVLAAETCDDSALHEGDDEAASERIYSLTQTLQRVTDSSQLEISEPDVFPEEENEANEEIEIRKKELASIEKLKKLFEGCKFYLSREVPFQSLAVLIRSCGGEVSWDRLSGYGSTYGENEESITHQVVDRPVVPRQYLSRYYIQPQWVYDCINARMVLSVSDYFPGCVLPPHLSPFVEEKPEDYVPPEKLKLLQLQGEDISSFVGNLADEKPDVENIKLVSITPKEEKDEKEEIPKRKRKQEESSGKPEMAVSEGKVPRTRLNDKMTTPAEDKKLQEMMIARKHQWAYKRMRAGEKQHAKHVRKLKAKRNIIDKQTAA